jgi:hypothetical protein
MKKLVLISTFLMSFFGFGQEIDILYNTTWKLFQFDYNGVNYNNSIPSESNTGLLDINEQNPDTFSTFIKTNSISGTITIDEGNETMDIFDTSITLLDCEEYCDLEAAYIEFFYNDGNPIQFTYSIVVFLNDIEFILSITDSQGNQAQYYDIVLSQEGFDNSSFSIYPNPASNYLNWTNNIFSYLKIYSIQGELLGDYKALNGTLDISGLKAGVYFVEFKNETQRVVKKFIKN